MCVRFQEHRTDSQIHAFLLLSESNPYLNWFIAKSPQNENLDVLWLLSVFLWFGTFFPHSDLRPGQPNKNPPKPNNMHSFRIKNVDFSIYCSRRVDNPEWTGKKFQSEFFDLTGYKKGTLHMTFRDPSLWERFNIEAAKGKNWLPDDYKTK